MRSERSRKQKWIGDREKDREMDLLTETIIGQSIQRYTDPKNYLDIEVTLTHEYI